MRIKFKDAEYEVTVEFFELETLVTLTCLGISADSLYPACMDGSGTNLEQALRDAVRRVEAFYFDRGGR